jgi:hypothetical protein
MDRHVGINELTSRAHDTYASIGRELDDRQVQSRAYKALRKERTLAESAFTRWLLKREKLSKTHAAQAELERAEREALNRQIQTLTERPKEVEEDRDLKKHRKALERLVAKQNANSAKRQKKKEDLDRLIDDQDRQVEKAEASLAESVREESRLQALIDEQYFRLDTRRKAFMDAIRLSCRNIFCKLAMEFRPLYNNYRDDHVIVRELTRSAGIIQQREGIVHILLIPTMEFQPATRSIVQNFLAVISQQINQHFASRHTPIQIQLLNEESNDLTIDQHGLRWVSSPP